MKKKFIYLFATVACLTLSIGTASLATTNTYNSKGKILFDNDTSEISDDVIFDSNDFKTIDTMITDGKSHLAAAINAYPHTNVATLDTFDNLATAIEKLTDVPNIYYYDKSTEGIDCKRYIYEDGFYYPCDEHGVKTSNTALTETVIIVSKDDSSQPLDGEIYLVPYTKAESNNLSAGFVGYVNKELVLGSGADNMSYLDKGFELKPCILNGTASSNPAPQPGYNYTTGATTTTFTNTDNVWSYVYVYVSNVYFPPATKYEWATGKVTLTVKGKKDGTTTTLGTYTGNGPYDFTDEDFERYKIRLDIKEYDEISFVLVATGTGSDRADQGWSTLAGKGKYEFH